MFKQHPRRLALTAVMIGSIVGTGVMSVAAQEATSAPPQGFGGRGGTSILDFGVTDLTDSPLVIAAASALGIDAQTLVDDLQAGKSLSDVATAQNVDVQTVYTALIDKEKERLMAEVSAGYLTQDAADTQLATYTANVANVQIVRMGRGGANGGPQGNSPRGNGGSGPQGNGGQPPQMPNDGTPDARPTDTRMTSPLMTAVADSLGLDADTLVNELMAGQSLTDIATAQNVDVQKVYDAIIAEQKKLLDAAVASGYLTQEQADARLETFTTHVATFQIMAGPRGGRGGNGGGNGGPDGNGGQPPQPPSGG